MARYRTRSGIAQLDNVEFEAPDNATPEQVEEKGWEALVPHIKFTVEPVTVRSHTEQIIERMRAASSAPFFIHRRPQESGKE